MVESEEQGAPAKSVTAKVEPVRWFVEEYKGKGAVDRSEDLDDGILARSGSAPRRGAQEGGNGLPVVARDVGVADPPSLAVPAKDGAGLLVDERLPGDVMAAEGQHCRREGNVRLVARAAARRRRVGGEVVGASVAETSLKMWGDVSGG